MLRPTFAAAAALIFAAAAPAQNMDIIRSDNIANTIQLRINNHSFVRAHPSLAWFVFPFEALPDYNYGYAQTSPCFTGARWPVIGNALYNRIFFQNANVPMNFLARASGHTFQKAPPGPFALVGPVEFWGWYSSTGIIQRDIVLNGPVTMHLSGPTADLSATLTSNRIGPGRQVQYHVTGFYIDQNGINGVNLITQPGGISFATHLNVAPVNFDMPLARLDVPTARLTQQPKRITSAFFKAYYELRLQ